MAKVSYIREIEAFAEYAAETGIKARERTLWYALMHVVNRRAQGAEWPDGFTPITSDRLMYLMGVKKADALIEARKLLKDAGRIDFIPGNRNKAVAKYKINYFFAQESSADPEKRSNIGSNLGSNIGSNSGSNIGSIYKDLDRDIDATEDGDCQEPDGWTDGFDARGRAISGWWLESMGREATPAQVQAITRAVTGYGMQDALAEIAIRRMALRNPDSPLQYTLQILQEWQRRGILTEDAYYDYQTARDMASGVITGVRDDAALLDVELSALKNRGGRT